MKDKKFQKALTTIEELECHKSIKMICYTHLLGKRLNEEQCGIISNRLNCT